MDAEGRFWIAVLVIVGLTIASLIAAITIGALASIDHNQKMGAICLSSGGSWVVLSGGSYGCLYGNRKP